MAQWLHRVLMATQPFQYNPCGVHYFQISLMHVNRFQDILQKGNLHYKLPQTPLIEAKMQPQTRHSTAQPVQDALHQLVPYQKTDKGHQT